MTNRSKSVRVQNKALRLLSDLPSNVPCPLTFDKLYTHRILCQFYKYIYSNNVNNYVYTNANKLLPTHSHDTRFHDNESLILPPIHKSIVQRQCFYNSIVEWNKLPLQLRKLDLKKLKYEFKGWVKLN